MTLFARDIMNRDVIAVPTTMDLRDLARMFLEQGITGAPVVNEDGGLVGVISQTDLIFYSLTRPDQLVTDSHFYQTARMEGRHVPVGFQVEDCNTGTVADVMTPVVHSVTEKASVDGVARMMTRKHIHRVIVRSGNKVTGVISALDVLQARLKAEAAASRAVAKKKQARAAAQKSKPAKKSKAAKKTKVAKKARPAARKSSARRRPGSRR
jgi:CBS domain-containing protein